MGAGEASIGSRRRDSTDDAFGGYPCGGSRGERRPKSEGVTALGAVADSEAGGVCPRVPCDEGQDGGAGVDVKAHTGDTFD